MVNPFCSRVTVRPAISPTATPNGRSLSQCFRSFSLEVATHVAKANAGAPAFQPLTLAATGLFGVMAYLVVLRTREFGIRVALGASPAVVTRSVLGQGIRLTVVGLVLGIVVSYGTAQLIAASVFGLAASDALTITGVAILLVGVAALASFVPARRVARINPAQTLRAE